MVFDSSPVSFVRFCELSIGFVIWPGTLGEDFRELNVFRLPSRIRAQRPWWRNQDHFDAVPTRSIRWLLLPLHVMANEKQSSAQKHEQVLTTVRGSLDSFGASEHLLLYHCRSLSTQSSHQTNPASMSHLMSHTRRGYS